MSKCIVKNYSPTNNIKAFRALSPELAFMKDVEMFTLLVFKQQLYAAYCNFRLNMDNIP